MSPFILFNNFQVLVVIVTLSSISVSFTSSSYDFEHGVEWISWKGEHKKIYKSFDEEKRRYSIWLDNKKYIEEHNNKNASKLGFTLKMNQFGDLTLEEYSIIYTCHLVGNTQSNSTLKGKQYYPSEDTNLPSSLDWRKKKVVARVKAQGEYRCHSCYAFSAVGALESHHAISSGSKVRLSEQNVIDCSKEYGNSGCNGGNYRKTFEYIIKNGGIDTESYYPYKAKKNSCKFSSDKIGATMTNFAHIKTGSESALLNAVAMKGPVIVSIDHRHKSFQFYGGGIYSESNCYTNYYLLTHEMLVVGYGAYQSKDYWIIKNSYGYSWGRWGYMLMIRGQNSCGIASDAAFPIL